VTTPVQQDGPPGAAEERATWLERLFGQTALIEAGCRQGVGTVVDVAGARVSVAFDEEPWADGDLGDVSISVFARDALYRLAGHARVLAGFLACEPDVTIPYRSIPWGVRPWSRSPDAVST
jgi:hypothetical protein